MHEHLIYEVQPNGDLMWFRHLGEDDGTFRWQGPNKVGTGWGSFKHVFGAGNGVIYGVAPSTANSGAGELSWYRHTGRADGSIKWEGPAKVGVGWGDLAQVFAGGDGIVYGVTPVVSNGSRVTGGELVWFRHIGQPDGSFRWEGPKTVGTGWGEMSHVFSGGDGVIYAVKAKVDAGVMADGSPRKAAGGELLWFSHLGRDTGTAQWLGPRTVGTGWGDMSQVFPGEEGIIYGITPMIQPGVKVNERTPRASGGDLMWFRHLGRADGSFKWEGPSKVGRGWGEVKHVFSGGDNHALVRLAAQVAMGKAWERLGGPKSVLGLARGDAIDVRSLTEGYGASFRGGELHLMGDGKTAFVESHDTVNITLVAIECQIRQESRDEIFGVVSVIGASGGTLATTRFPSSDTLKFADGQRIVNLELPLFSNGIVQNYSIIATLVENDSGDVEDISKRLADKISDSAAKGLGALTGAPAEAVGDSESFKEGIITGLKFLLGDIFGIGDDPYNPEAMRLAWSELRSEQPPSTQPTVHRGDDPHTIENWTHRLTLSGIDDGGDRGQYALYFRVEVPNISQTIHVNT